MKKREKMKYLVMGIVLTLMVSAISIPTLAALTGKTIEVFTGVNIYVDDVKLSPTDVNGNPVEVFVYNGTTYLPVRAVGEALDKTVQWEGATRSVYLGEHTGEAPAVMLHQLDYIKGEPWSMDKDKEDNYGKHYNEAITGDNNLRNTYALNGQYSKITGTFFQQYENRSAGVDSEFQIYGDGKLLFEADMTGGVKPVTFDVDLTGVLEMEIYFSSGPTYNINGCSSLGDCGLWT